MKQVIEAIIASKRGELAELRKRRLPPSPGARAVALRRAPGDALKLIAEIKRRSPSAGALSRALSVAERAQAYEQAGASMVSVLCDGPFFDGAYEHLTLTRNACSLPVLCKEFVLDECQLDAAHAFGADAVLLIVRCLDSHRLAQLIEAARTRGLTPLVEVHQPAEAVVALDAGADLIGVNARDLDTLEMDPERAAAVLESLPAAVARVHLSGIHLPEHLASVVRSRADAALVGESLMRCDDPRPLLRSLVAACTPSP
jgi:indole-3-glycerol phosphate synthase